MLSITLCDFWLQAQPAHSALAAARCFLESFGEEQVQRMTLSQVSRALRIASTIARAAVLGAELPVDGTLSPLQQQLLASVARLYAQPAPASGPDASASPSTDTAQSMTISQ